VRRILVYRETLYALGLCLAGGAVARLLRIPLPWMIGPMLAMAAGKLAGMRLHSPRGGREMGQTLIATTLGLYFTSAVAREVLHYGPLMLLTAMAAVLLGYGCGLLLARLTGTDKITAFFGSVPGGATEMAVLGARHGALVDRVALAQAMRILIVVIVVPGALTMAGAHGTHAYQPVGTGMHAGGLALLLLFTGLGGLALHRLRIPNSWMLGPLFVSIALTVSGVQLSAMPPLLASLGQLLVGCTLGARFERRFMLSAPRYVGGVVASVLTGIGISALLAMGLSWVSGIPLPSLVLATAPGGIAEMCITAQVLQLGVPMVTAFHVTRVILLVTCTAPLYRLAQRLRREREP